ncbi:MAG: HDOD domain-containing protein, partial [Melioribacteraceae bacterium]|nr:HDOD domain-containing protein [Melioribacteraceae bacterium]
HHKPSDSPEEDVLTSIVHLVDYMTQKLEIGGYYLDKGMELDESVISVLGLGSLEETDVFIESYRELFAQEVNSDLFA